MAVEVTDLQWFVEVCICQQQSKLLHRKVQAKKVKYKKHMNMFLTYTLVTAIGAEIKTSLIVILTLVLNLVKNN